MRGRVAYTTGKERLSNCQRRSGACSRGDSIPLPRAGDLYRDNELKDIRTQFDLYEISRMGATKPESDWSRLQETRILVRYAMRRQEDITQRIGTFVCTSLVIEQSRYDITQRNGTGRFKAMRTATAQ